MQLLNPLALVYLPLIAAVLLLAKRHVVRVRRGVGAWFLWSDVDPRNHQTSRLKLRRQWLLLVQAMLLLALAAALARPTIAVTRPRAVFLVDVSASMGARQDGATRLTLAARKAEESARTLPSGTRVTIWTTPGRRFDDVDSEGVRDVFSRVVASDGRADIGATLRTIRAVEGNSTQVLVFTDQSAADPVDTNLRWINVGTTMPNLAVTSLAGRQIADPVAATELVVGVRNFSGEEVEAPIELRQRASVVTSERMRVPAHSTMTAVLTVPPTIGVVSAHLANSDALESDNVRFVVLPAAPQRNVLLIGTGNYFLERALTSMPGVALETISPGERGTRDRYDVVVCDRCADAPGLGPTLMVRPPSTASLEPMRVVGSGHRVVRFLEATAANIVPVTGLPLADDAVVLARAGATPVIVASDSSGDRSVDLRLDLRESPLVLDTAFPILMSNAVAWLTHDGENATAIVAGESLRWTLDNAEPVSIRGPDGTEVPASTSGNILSVSATLKAGAYDVRQAERHAAFVVNPATDTESDLTVASTQAPSPVLAFQSSPETVTLTAALLVAVLLLLAAEVFLSHPLPTRAVGVRVFVAAAVLAAAAGPRIPWGTARANVVFVLDRSASIPPAVQAAAVESINRLSQSMRNGDRAGLVVFGAEAAVESPLDQSLRVSTITARTTASATNVEAALGLAREQLRGSAFGRAVLLSDGQETLGSGLQEAARLATADLAVDVVPLNVGISNDGLSVTAVTAPPLVRTGEPFPVSAFVRGRVGMRADVEVKRDAASLATLPITVGPDGTAIAELTDVHRTQGIHTYTASLRVEGVPDSQPDAGSAVTVSGQPSLLYVSDGRRTLMPLLASVQWNVESASIATLPAGAALLSRYDAIVLEDVAADRLKPAQSTALAEYVEEAGGGLLMVGGSGTLGSFRTSALNRILPVDLRPRTGARGPGMALVLAFDKSGSMADVVGGVSKIELARQSVLGALQSIPPTDLFGAIAFDARPVSIAPLASANDLPSVTRRLRALEAAGSTAIAPAIDLAETWLSGSGVARRRVLLVTDGRSSPADLDRLRTAVRSRRFELSVVAIGDNANQEVLTSLAVESGGRAYFPTDVSELPKIVARDAAAASSGTVVAERFTARIAPHAATRGLSPTNSPALSGYAVSAAKPGAEMILASHLGDPVLAGWRIGLGRVAVFTSDLNAAAPAITDWSGSDQLWAQTARWVGRHVSSEDARVAMEAIPDGLRLRLTFEPATGARRIVAATASLRGPSGQRVPLVLNASSPGGFTGTASLSNEGTYIAAVAIRRADGSEEQVVQGAYWSAAAERPTPPDLTVLNSIAQATGGRVLTGDESPFVGARPGQPTDIGPLLTNVALLALLADIARSRGLFSFWTRRRARTAVAPRQAAA
jgi:Ca-activated chloride channel homolog